MQSDVSESSTIGCPVSALGTVASSSKPKKEGLEEAVKQAPNSDDEGGDDEEGESEMEPDEEEVASTKWVSQFDS
jgi:hypothetical protein